MIQVVLFWLGYTKTRDWNSYFWNGLNCCPPYIRTFLCSFAYTRFICITVIGLELICHEGVFTSCLCFFVNPLFQNP